MPGTKGQLLSVISVLGHILPSLLHEPANAFSVCGEQREEGTAQMLCLDLWEPEDSSSKLNLHVKERG